MLIRPVDRKIFEERVFPREYSVMVYTEGNNYYAKNQDGVTICSNSPTACLQKAVDYLQQFGGGRVLVRKGSYQVSQVVIDSARDIMLEFEEGAVLNVVDAPDLKTYQTEDMISMPVVYIVNSENIYIKGGTIIDTGVLRGQNIYRDGVLVKNSKYVNIEGIVVKGVAGNGIRINGQGTYDFSNPDNSNLLTKHVTIRNCRVEDTKTYKYDSTYYVKGFSIEIEHSEDVYVERCTVYNSGESSFRTHAARKVVFIGNYVYNQILGDPFDIWGSDNVVIAFNKVVVPQGNLTASGIYLYLYTRNIYIIGNDVVTPSDAVQISLYDVTGNTIENVWIMYNRIPGYIGLANSRMKNIYIIGNDIGKQIFVNPKNKVYANNIVIEGNVFRDASINNIYVGNADFVVIRRNYMPSTIMVEKTDKVIVEDNVIYGPSDTTYRPGIVINGSVNYALIMDNYIYNPTYQAILVANPNNGVVDVIRNIVESAASACSGCATIQASNGSVSLVRIRNNIIRNSLGNRSVYIGTDVVAEILDNIVDKPIDINGTAVVRRNVGYVTESSGVATIAAGQTRVTVSHGLVRAPTKVLITPLASPPGKLWVENITSTSFDIVTDTAPTSDLPIAWYAEV